MPAQPPLVAGRSGCGGLKGSPRLLGQGLCARPSVVPPIIYGAQLRSFNKSVLGRIILVPQIK